MITITKPDIKKLNFTIRQSGVEKPVYAFILESQSKNNQATYKFDVNAVGDKLNIQLNSENLAIGKYSARLEVVDNASNYFSILYEDTLDVLQEEKKVEPKPVKLKRLIKTKIEKKEIVHKPKPKPVKETTQANNITGAGGGLQGYMDREAPWSPIKYYPGTDTYKSFMKRCIAVETSKNIKKPPEKAAELCELLWREFTAELSPSEEYEKVKGVFKKTINEMMERDENEFEELANFLLELDVDLLNSQQIDELDDILSYFNEPSWIRYQEETSTGGIATTTSRIGPSANPNPKLISRIDAGLLRTHKTPSIARAKQRRYDKLMRVQIAKKRRQIAKKKSVSGQKKERDKKVMAKSNRTGTGRDRKKYNKHTEEKSKNV